MYLALRRIFVIILNADDLIFTEITPGLNFDELQAESAGIFQRWVGQWEVD